MRRDWVSAATRGTRIAIFVIVMCGLVAACGKASRTDAGGSHAQSTTVASDTTARVGLIRHTAISFDPTDKTKPKLAISGDSITFLATRELVDEFSPDFNISIHARIGIATRGMSSAIAEDARERPDIEIISLGTNDVRCTSADGCGKSYYQIPQFNATSVEKRLDSFAAEFPPTTCVLFVTINAHNPSWNPVGSRELNRYFRAKEHVLDWDAMWKPGYFGTVDSPHPNTEGRKVLAKALHKTVDGCPKSNLPSRSG